MSWFLNEHRVRTQTAPACSKADLATKAGVQALCSGAESGEQTGAPGQCWPPTPPGTSVQDTRPGGRRGRQHLPSSSPASDPYSDSPPQKRIFFFFNFPVLIL